MPQCHKRAEVKTKSPENKASTGCAGCLVPTCPAEIAGCAAPVQCAGKIAREKPTVNVLCGCEVSDFPKGEPISADSGDEQLNKNFGPFITDGFISLVGDSENKKQVKILRDTGASESFVSETALPFSSLSSTG